MTSVDLFLKLEYGNCNGVMSVSLNGQDVVGNTVNIKVKFPSQLTITLSGKNYSRDTLIDSNGLIISDKYVKLLDMRLGGVPIEEQNLVKIINYQTDLGNTVQSNYWGFNGTITINLDRKDFIRYLLSINNKFDINN